MDSEIRSDSKQVRRGAQNTRPPHLLRPNPIWQLLFLFCPARIPKWSYCLPGTLTGRDKHKRGLIDQTPRTYSHQGKTTTARRYWESRKEPKIKKKREPDTKSNVCFDGNRRGDWKFQCTSLCKTTTRRSGRELAWDALVPSDVFAVVGGSLFFIFFPSSSSSYSSPLLRTSLHLATFGQLTHSTVLLYIYIFIIADLFCHHHTAQKKKYIHK